MDAIINMWVPGEGNSRGPLTPSLSRPTPPSGPSLTPGRGTKLPTDPDPDDSDGNVAANVAGPQPPSTPPQHAAEYYAPSLIRIGAHADGNIVMKRVNLEHALDRAERELLYYAVPKERFDADVELTDGSPLPHSVTDGLCPKLKIRFWEAPITRAGLGESTSDQLRISSSRRSFTNYSSRHTDTKTGDIVMEFCLDWLKSELVGGEYSPIFTPRGKPSIDLDYGCVGIVERVCVCLRKAARSEAGNPGWTLDIISPFRTNSYSVGFATLMARLDAGTLWTQLAVDDPRRLVLEIVRAIFSWRNLDEELRTKVASTCEELLAQPMTGAIKGLHDELRVLQDFQLALESNMGFVTALQDDLANVAVQGSSSPEGAENDEVIAEFRSIGSGLKQNLLFVKQLKEEVATTIDMIFSAVQVDQSMQAFEESGLAYKQAESMRRLTYLTVFFLPATFIATIFGMNSPATASPPLWLYFVISVPVSVVSFCLLYGMRYIPDRQDILPISPFKLPAPHTVRMKFRKALGVVSCGRWGGEEAAPLPTTIKLCYALSPAPHSYQISETEVQRSRHRILPVRRQQQPSTATLDDSGSATTVSTAPHQQRQDYTGSPVETPEVEHVVIPAAVGVVGEAGELVGISEVDEPGDGRHGDLPSFRTRARLVRSARRRPLVPSRTRYSLSDAEASTQGGGMANVTAKAELPPRPKKKGANLSFNDRYGGGSEPEPSHAAPWSSSRSPWSRLTSRNRARVDEAEAEDPELK